MNLNMANIEKSVVNEVADRLVNEEYLSDLAVRLVNERIDALFVAGVTAKLQAEIERVVVEGFEREYRAVDSWGKPVGEVTTIGKELEKQVKEYWNQKVDGNGKPSTSGYGKQMTRAEWLMFKICSEDFSALMQQQVVNAAGAFKDGLRASLQGTVNECLSSVLRVASLGDRGLERTGPSCIDPKAK